MYRLWEEVVGPLVKAVSPRVIVEVGVAGGAQTRRLLELSREIGAELHAVDPAPRDLPPELTESPSLTLHRELSLEALAGIGPVDLALLDGDHNWYTVIEELRALSRSAREAGRAMPVVICHDVGWPYGRRDLYYAPERIPERFRQPWRQAGIVPGRSDLADDGSGLNAHLCNASREGGPRNGVLTAIEDFLDECEEELSLTVLPALHGVGILAPASRIEAAPELSEELAQLNGNGRLERLLELTEAERVRSLVAAQRGKQKKRAHGEFDVDLPPEVILGIQEGIKSTSYRGLKLLKSPFDLSLYTELISRIRPRSMIEIGSKEGGSALWFADLMSANGIDGTTISVDLIPPDLSDQRIRFERGDANELEDVLSAEFLGQLPRPLIVSEDSSHMPDTTLRVLEFFDQYLRAGDYIVVEDGVLSQLSPEHYRRWGEGPNAAVRDFLASRPGRYEIDRDLCDRFGRNVTWSPNAWLRRL